MASVSAVVVNLATVAGAHLASKAAVRPLTRALASEWAAQVFGANAIAAGFFLPRPTQLENSTQIAWCVTANPRAGAVVQVASQ